MTSVMRLRSVVACNVATVRNACGLTQAALAEAAGVSWDAVAQIEGGEGDVCLSTLVAMAEAVETCPIVLLLSPLAPDKVWAWAQDPEPGGRPTGGDRATVSAIRRMRALLASRLPG